MFWKSLEIQLLFNFFTIIKKNLNSLNLQAILIRANDFILSYCRNCRIFIQKINKLYLEYLKTYFIILLTYNQMSKTHKEKVDELKRKMKVMKEAVKL